MNCEHCGKPLTHLLCPHCGHKIKVGGEMVQQRDLMTACGRAIPTARPAGSARPLAGPAIIPMTPPPARPGRWLCVGIYIAG